MMLDRWSELYGDLYDEATGLFDITKVSQGCCLAGPGGGKRWQRW